MESIRLSVFIILRIVSFLFKDYIYILGITKNIGVDSILLMSYFLMAIINSEAFRVKKSINASASQFLINKLKKLYAFFISLSVLT